MNQTFFDSIKKKVKTRSVQRILVALDASPHSLTALEAAAELAQELEAELIGIFVEDVNLLKLAGLPFAREVQFPKATTQKLDMPVMESQLRQQAGRAREMLRQIADRDALAWTFRVARGVVAAEVLAAAMEADLLVLGRVSRRLSHAPLGSTARTAVTHSKPPVLLLGSDFDLGRPLLVFYDGSPAAEAALRMAGELAQISGYLGVIVWADSESVGRFQNEIIGRLRNYDLIVNFRHVSNSAEAAGVVQRANAGMVVIGDTGTPFIHSIIHTVLEQTDHPVLVVR